MIPNPWVKKIVRFYNQPIFCKVQSVLNMIPFQPIKISRFFSLSLKSIPEISYIRGVTLIRLATVADIKGMCLLENKPHLFRARFERGEYCVVALEKDEVVGFEWFSVADFFIEERFNYKIIIPSDTVYAYNAYIKASYRLRGIWIQFKQFLKKWMNEENGRNQVLVLIDYGNDLSIRTHLRFGFNIVNDVHWIKLFTKAFFIKKDVSLTHLDIKTLLTR